MEDMLTTDYDGCGRCLVGVRRLSRKTDKTSSPARQADQILQATADVDGHIGSPRLLWRPLLAGFD